MHDKNRDLSKYKNWLVNLIESAFFLLFSSFKLIYSLPFFFYEFFTFDRARRYFYRTSRWRRGQSRGGFSRESSVYLRAFIKLCEARRLSFVVWHCCTAGARKPPPPRSCLTRCIIKTGSTPRRKFRCVISDKLITRSPTRFSCPIYSSLPRPVCSSPASLCNFVSLIVDLFRIR